MLSSVRGRHVNEATVETFMKKREAKHETTNLTTENTEKKSFKYSKNSVNSVVRIKMKN